MPTTLIQPASRTSRYARKKGAIGVSTAIARGGIATVYEMLGGVHGLLDWAKTNKDVFYGQLLPKLIPAEIADAHGSSEPIRVLVYAPQNGKAPEVLATLPQGVVEEAHPVLSQFYKENDINKLDESTS